MRAVAIKSFGGPENLAACQMPDPQPEVGEVTIDVEYAGVNYLELMFRRGFVAVPLPFVPGIEVAGHIRAVGEGVTDLQVGQPVAALTIVGQGGYAEVVRSPAALTFALDTLERPVDLAAAAAFPCTMITAYLVLSAAARFTPGDAVLVHAAAGGLGSALGQVARRLGAGQVLGTVGSPDKIAYAQAHGYDRVFLREHYREAVIAATGGAGVQIVVDPVGGNLRSESLEVLSVLGQLIVLGNAGNGEDTFQSTNGLWLSSKGVQGFNLLAVCLQAPEKIKDAARRVLEWIARDELHVPISGVLPLEAADEAHRRIEQRATTGKLILKIGR
ncbi:quinone oxidoreductase family protein [Gloeobacter violaceus]|uniref:Quinone oxidoreductase n=1 Tax=Gloeobacter violaceus (strain ATCC 29082 / PCC 7421) TaxID=251221 RepID=Q7ND01_GLOVI|nr:zinc-binding dehydrogenase [Gloeobacter violaceus]BAC90766.1 quinone oxidoreductase [Gloeobacter violaceus PCC 7421]